MAASRSLWSMMTRLAALALVVTVAVLALAPVTAEAAADNSIAKAKTMVPDFAGYTMAQLKDLTFYELLGVPQDADDKTIKRNFRVLSLKQHPDKATSDEDRKRRELLYPRFVLASDTLSDERKRLNYNHLLELGRRPGAITDMDIANAWDAERGVWVTEVGAALFEDWHALLIVVIVTLAGFAYPFYSYFNAKKEKEERARAAAAQRKAQLQAIAAKAKALNEKEAAQAAAKKAQQAATKRTPNPAAVRA